MGVSREALEKKKQNIAALEEKIAQAIQFPELKPENIFLIHVRSAYDECTRVKAIRIIGNAINRLAAGLDKEGVKVETATFITEGNDTLRERLNETIATEIRANKTKAGQRAAKLETASIEKSMKRHWQRFSKENADRGR